MTTNNIQIAHNIYVENKTKFLEDVSLTINRIGQKHPSLLETIKTCGKVLTILHNSNGSQPMLNGEKVIVEYCGKNEIALFNILNAIYQIPKNSDEISIHNPIENNSTAIDTSKVVIDIFGTQF